MIEVDVKSLILELDEKNRATALLVVDEKLFVRRIRVEDVTLYPVKPSAGASTADVLPEGKEYLYTIFRVGDMYYAENRLTGKIDYCGTDAATVIQSAIDDAMAQRTRRSSHE